MEENVVTYFKQTSVKTLILSSYNTIIRPTISSLLFSRNRSSLNRIYVN
jgi:hypothetical protein